MQLMRIRYSLRSLVRDPAFALIVILVLSLGIAVNTTIFSLIDQLVFNPLPYKDPSRLVMVWESNPSIGEPAGSRVPAAWSNFAEWRNQSQSFEALEAFEVAGYNLTGLGVPEHLTAARATGGYFQMLGTNAERGRALTPEDGQPGADAVAVITSAFEKAHFASEDALGSKLLLNGVPYTIVGVLPRGFHLPRLFQGAYEYKPDVWVAMPAISALDLSKFRRLFVTARLKDNTLLAQARAEMITVGKRLEQIDPELNKGYSVNLVSLKIENADPDFERALYILWAAAFVVLLLGCANLASLMLVRAMNKQKNLAIMRALGAPKSALIANILTEGALLVVVACTFAVLGSYAGVGWVRAAKPGDLAGSERLSLSMASLFFAVGAFILCALIFALLPAWLSTRQPLNALLRRPANSEAGGVGTTIRRVLVCGEVAIAVVLTIGATLLARSFRQLLDVDPGFRAKNVLTARIVLGPPHYTATDARQHFCERLLDRVRQIPMVESASLVDNFPLYSIHYTSFEIEGRPVSLPSALLTADFANTTSEFFQTMGTPLRRGRLFTPEDLEDSAEKVVIVNESLAKKLWPNLDAVGSHIRSIIPHREAGSWRRVIGVVGDFRQFNIDTPPRPEMFWPARQYREMTLVVRTAGDPKTASQLLRSVVAEIDKEQPLSDVQTLQQMVDHSIAQRRFNTYLLSGFAGLSIILALVGVYGLISYIVSSRNRDISIRLALGAQRMHVLKAVLAPILPFAAIGTFLGLLLSFLLRKLVVSLLFGISPLDPTTYVTLPAMIAMLILCTCLRPGWKAAHIDPVKTLRQE